MEPLCHRPQVAVLMRGHERGAFCNKKMIDFMKSLSLRHRLHLYVHTWSESEAKVSHRPLDRSRVRAVTATDVLRYFQGIEVKWVGVDDDERIDLVGPAQGRVGGIPKRAWKNMWYGQHCCVAAILGADTHYDAVLNIRMDNFINRESRFHVKADVDTVTRRLEAALQHKEGVMFIRDRANIPGIDNCYIGTLACMKQLIDRFHLQLDSVLEEHPDTWHQEFMVFYEAARMGLLVTAASLPRQR